MSIAAVLIGLLNVALTCAIIVFIAFCIVWLLNWFGVAIDPQVYKWGRIIVGLMCLIVIVSFLLSLLGAGNGYVVPHIIRP